MASMIFRELFSEMPYAAALYNENLTTHCSNCFVKPAADQQLPCGTGCEMVVYCSEKCRDLDRKYHELECNAFKKIGKKMDAFVRLLARIVARKCLDNGIVHLSENFPRHVPDRCLADLMPHQEEIESCPHRSKDMKATLDEFRTAFEGTLLMEDWILVRRIYCIMWINCFSVSGPLDMKQGHGSNVGLGFYLNVSRFNHSCLPDIFVDFDGARLIVLYPSVKMEQNEVTDERAEYTSSVEKFNNLTISYGYSHSFTNESFFPFRQQRRDSLEFAYYFTCHCPICDDDDEAALEENAAAIECVKCGEPYLWQEAIQERKAVLCWSSSSASKTTMICTKICACENDQRQTNLVKAYLRSINDKFENVKKWDNVMYDSMKNHYADDIIKMCEPVLMKVRKYWHNSRNLRMAQLNERLFVSYNVLVASSWKKKEPIDPKMLRMSLETGEALLAWIKKHPLNSYHTAAAAYAYELAKLFEIAAMNEQSATEVSNKRKRAKQWYSFAAAIWKLYGENARKIVDHLTNAARIVGKDNAEIKKTENDADDDSE